MTIGADGANGAQPSLGEWLETYSSREFEEAAASLEDLLDRLAGGRGGGGGATWTSLSSCSGPPCAWNSSSLMRRIGLGKARNALGGGRRGGGEDRARHGSLGQDGAEAEQAQGAVAWQLHAR